MFEALINEWAHFPTLLASLATSPMIWLVTFLGVLFGYVIGVLPGLGATMGMAMMFGIINRIPPEWSIALLMSILISSLCSGGITSILINIPGTPAAAATVLDGHPLFKQGRGREAVGASVYASAIGTATALLVVSIIQPFMFTIALRMGDWEVFLFCVFGVLICGALAGNSILKGMAAGILGLLFAMVGLEEMQGVRRFTFGMSGMLIGIPEVSALLGLFGLSEVFINVHRNTKISKESMDGVGWLIFPVKVLKDNIKNLIRSLLAGLWVGIIPGIGESAACWFGYDIAKRNSKNKELFGKGSFEGVIAAESASNVSSVGALIPSLALGIPGSATSGILIAALFLIGYRPGPSMLSQSPGIIVTFAILGWMAVIMSVIVAFMMSKAVIKLFTIPINYLMPIVAVFCIIGAWGTGFTKHHIVVLLVFGIIGFLMKLRGFPVAPMVLGLLIGRVFDLTFRRALVTYALDPFAMFMRPFGLAVTIVLILVFIFSLKSASRSA